MCQARVEHESSNSNSNSLTGRRLVLVVVVGRIFADGLGRTFSGVARRRRGGGAAGVGLALTLTDTSPYVPSA